jgi:hypothetical protein
MHRKRYEIASAIFALTYILKGCLVLDRTRRDGRYEYDAALCASRFRRNLSVLRSRLDGALRTRIAHFPVE